MKLLRICLPLSVLMLLQACVSVQNKSTDQASTLIQQAHIQNIASIKQFTLHGRIGVQADGKGFSGGILWQHQPELDEISLTSPLGGEVAHIQKTTTSATLTDAKGNQLSASDIDSLTLKALGWQLPLEGLVDWALGRPANNPIIASTWNDKGYLTTLNQLDWLIEYQNYSASTEAPLPQKITLRNDKIFLKLLVEDWSNILK